MAKTLVVKLAGTVDNDDLRKLGEMCIQITPYTQGEPNSTSQGIMLGVAEPIEVKLTGNGYFTDKTLTENLGTTMSIQGDEKMIYVSNSTSMLHIYNRSVLTRLMLNSAHPHWTVDLADLNGIHSMRYIEIQSKAKGDFSLKWIRDNNNLLYVLLNIWQHIRGKVTGDLSELKGYTGSTLNLVSLPLITGNLSSIANMRGLTFLQLIRMPLVNGDTSSIAHLHPNNGGKLSHFAYAGSGITGSWPPASE